MCPQDPIPADLRRALAECAPDLRDRLRTVVEGRRDASRGHSEWGAFCEEAGEFGLAFTEYQLALRDDPGDVRALARLSVLYEERGELDRAIECARRCLEAAPDDGEALVRVVRLLARGQALPDARAILEEAGRRGVRPDLIESLRQEIEVAQREGEEAFVDLEAETTEPDVPSDADVVRFAHLFAGREEVYARQWWGPHGQGGYSPVREPFTPKVARNHLLGSITVGIYPVRLDDTVTFCAFDIDITKRALGRARRSVQEARRLKKLVADVSGRLLQFLNDLGLPALMEESGYKGRHLWLFFEQPEPARVVHHLGTLALGIFDPGTSDIHLEFFPKQPGTGGGVGNLIKLPLGIHRRTGRRSRLLTPAGEPERDPFGALRRQSKVSRQALHDAIGRLKTQLRPLETLRRPDAAASDEEDRERPQAPTVPAPPAPPAAWTAADFETNREIAHLLAKCPVLDALKKKVDRHRRLTHDEQVVLIHSLGHSGAGVLAVNYLLDACVDVPKAARLQTPLSGNPISCPKIRKRIPEVTASVNCNCEFPFAPDHYPTPRLHLLSLGPAEPAAGPPREAHVAWDPVERARALGVLWAKRERLAAEIEALEKELMAFLEREAVPALDTGDGVLRVVVEAGAPPALVWEPRVPAAPGAEPSAASEAPAVSSPAPSGGL